MPKSGYNWVPDFVYGGIDGVVTTFAVVAGVKGASLALPVILILGFANLVADGFSMAVGKYLSDKSSKDHLNKKGSDHAENINPFKGGLYTFISFNVVGLVPLLAYIFRPVLGITDEFTFTLACILTLIALFVIGFVKGRVDKTPQFKAGFQTMLIGGFAAVIAFGIGSFIEGLH